VLRYNLPHTDKGEPGAPDYRALGEFRYQIRRFLHFSEEAAKAHGLEPQQHQMLLAIRALDEPEGTTIGRLAERLFIRHHSAVGLVDRLVEGRLVRRVRGGEDRRQVRVQPTPEGEAWLKRLAEAHGEELRHSGPLLVAALSDVLEHLPASV
jgi:DNA-binding MarR family transcriptional regulator